MAKAQPGTDQSLHACPDTTRPEPEVLIDWQLPRPPYSLHDRLIGPGATRGELVLQWTAAIAAATVFPLLAVFNEWSWSPFQLIVAGLLALDVAGGVVTNATSTAKRWYHRPQRTVRDHLLFVLLHAHPFLVVWLFGTGEWRFATVGYGYMIIAAIILIVLTPLHLRRPVAFLAVGSGIILSIYGPVPPPHFEWLLPLLYLKVLAGHLLREEPYRPCVRAEPMAGEG